MGDQIKNVLIGIFVLAACSIVVFMLLFLHPSIGDEGHVLIVRFNDIDKISVGTRVTFAGKPVGQVSQIIEIPEEHANRHVTDGYVYTYELKLLIDSKINVYNSDQISSRTSGLLGEKSVAITPMSPKPGLPLRLLTNNEIVYATQTGNVEDSLKEFKDVVDKIEIAIEGVIRTIEDVNKSDIVQQVTKTAKNIADITGALNNPTEWSHLVSNVYSLSERAKTSWSSLDVTLNNIRNITEQIRNGEGSLGQVVMKDNLYLRMTSILSKAETTLNDVNHYGLMFNLDKGWQRLRARRMNLLTKLSTPQEFRNYFNDEMDQISTSLTRVSFVLDDQENGSQNSRLAEHKDFTKVFSELLRRVDALGESLKMYNQQIVDNEVKKTEL